MEQLRSESQGGTTGVRVRAEQLGSESGRNNWGLSQGGTTGV